MPAKDTKTTILDAAERLFAERGFDAVPMRMLVAHAEVNLAAVHYHFGSKQALVQAVIARRLRPINTERLALLDIEEAKARKRPVQLRNVLECFLSPVFRLRQDPIKGPMFMQLVGRVLGERNEKLRRFMVTELAEVVRRFSAALQRALPDLPKEEVLWRGHFMVGAMAHTLCNPDFLKQFSGGLVDKIDYEVTLRRLVAFAGAGFKAKPAELEKPVKQKKKPARSAAS